MIIIKSHFLGQWTQKRGIPLEKPILEQRQMEIFYLQFIELNDREAMGSMRRAIDNARNS
jgi:hypothetical protein